MVEQDISGRISRFPWILITLRIAVHHSPTPRGIETIKRITSEALGGNSFGTILLTRKDFVSFAASSVSPPGQQTVKSNIFSNRPELKTEKGYMVDWTFIPGQISGRIYARQTSHDDIYPYLHHEMRYIRHMSDICPRIYVRHIFFFGFHLSKQSSLYFCPMLYQ